MSVTAVSAGVLELKMLYCVVSEAIHRMQGVEDKARLNEVKLESN